MSPDDSCRLCKVNMRESGPRVYAHSTDMFVSKTTPTISDRLAMMDLIVTPEPEQSNRCCQRCTSTLGRLEKDFPLFRQWEENVRLSSVSKRQREPTPSKTPRTLKKTCPNPPSPLACSFGNTTTKIVATGVCHTDLYHLFEGMNKDGFPVVLGHEGAGIIESVGPGVTEFQPGDAVIPLFISQCGDCRFCKSPKTNQCEKGWAAERYDVMSLEDTRFTCKGKKVLQFLGTSTFSEYTVMNQIAVAKIDPAAPLDKVCLLGCGICTGYGAAVNTAKVEPGSTCAVFGLGAVGLAAVMGCYVAGAKRIIAVDINPEKFEKAKVFGANEFVNPKDYNKPINEVLFEMTNGGVDYSLECCGNVGVMRSALESCVKGWGVSVIVGWTDMHDFAARPIQLIAGRTWKGSLFGGFKSKDGVPEMVKAYLNKKIKLDEFITHKMTLAQVNDAIELMKHGKCIRTVLSISPQ